MQEIKLIRPKQKRTISQIGSTITETYKRTAIPVKKVGRGWSGLMIKTETSSYATMEDAEVSFSNRVRSARLAGYTEDAERSLFIGNIKSPSQRIERGWLMFKKLQERDTRAQVSITFRCSGQTVSNYVKLATGKAPKFDSEGLLIND